MKNLLVLAILGFSLNMVAQSADWHEVLKSDSPRNFEGYLYQNGIDINQCINIKGSDYHPVAAIIKLGAPALLDHVLSKDKVDLTTICEDKTILQYAIKYGDNVLVQKLIKAGADPHQQSYNGKTALDYAKKYDKPVIAGLLKSLHK